MTYSEIYKILLFEKTKLITKKIVMSTQIDFIIVIGSGKQHKAQIVFTSYEKTSKRLYIQILNIWL
jgi:hypothetical protein